MKGHKGQVHRYIYKQTSLEQLVYDEKTGISDRCVQVYEFSISAEKVFKSYFFTDSVHKVVANTTTSLINSVCWLFILAKAI